MKRITRASLFFTKGTNLLCVLLAIVGCLLGLVEARRALDFKRTELLTAARTLGETINPWRVRELQATPSDVEDPAYTRLSEQFISILPVLAPVLSVSLIAESQDGGAVYLVDARSTGGAGPGERFHPPFDEFVTAFRSGQPIVSSPYRAGDSNLWAAVVPLASAGKGEPGVAVMLQAEYPDYRRLLGERALVPLCGGVLLILVIQAGRRAVARPRKPGLLLAESLWALSIGLVLTGLFSRGADWYEFRTQRSAYFTLSYLESGFFLRELKELRDGYLEALGRFFESSDYVDRDEFGRYAEYLARVPYIDAVAWAPASYVHGDDRPSFVVVYSTPEDRPFLPEGKDLSFAQPMEEAVRVLLAERLSTLSGVLPDGDGACRKAALRMVVDPSGSTVGIVAIVVNLEAMLGGSMSGSDEVGEGVMDVRLARVLPDGSSQSLFALPREVASEMDGEALFRSVRPLFMMGQVLELETRPGSLFHAMHPRVAGRVAIYSGVLVSSLVALLTGLFFNWRGATLRFVEIKTASLAESEMQSKKLAHLYRSISEGVVIVDSKGFIQDCNPALEELTGFTLAEMRGHKPSLFAAREGQFGRAFIEELKCTGSWSGEVLHRKRDGETYPVWLSISAVSDGDGDPEHYSGVYRHIGGLKREQERLTRMAYHDFLTGLPNRALLMDRIEIALARARRERTMAVLLFVDLDFFKRVNDTFGHETGDALLIEVARRMRETHREQDTVARLAGDEFVILFEAFSQEKGFESILSNMRGLFSQPFRVMGHEIRIDASIGVSLYPRDGIDAKSLLAAADRAMYAEKREKKAREET
ncbi:MAG: diguanylate cyclase [Synergistaceae bacterium]|nr:diguanylate cyclase [Synergistota bacterium]NLM70745.1 diguanylate cyclase [Synergistaceae bacterium]